MKAKELAEELVKIEDMLEIYKRLMSECQIRFTLIKDQRYPKGITERGYKDIFKEVDSYFGSVVRNLIKLDSKFSDFSYVYKDKTNKVLEELGYQFRV